VRVKEEALGVLHPAASFQKLHVILQGVRLIAMGAHGVMGLNWGHMGFPRS